MTRVQVRRGPSTMWTASNPILAAGEPGLDMTTGLLKIGDGVTAWNSLASQWAPASLVESAPRGVVAIGTAIDGVVIAAANSTYMTGYLTYVFDPKRRYRIIFVIRALTAGTINFQLINQPTGTTNVNDQWFSSDRSYNGSTFSWLLPQMSGSYSLGVRIAGTYTAGITVYGRDYYLEDVGAYS